jgi:hypothetical protein
MEHGSANVHLAGLGYGDIHPEKEVSNGSKVRWGGVGESWETGRAVLSGKLSESEL